MEFWIFMMIMDLLIPITMIGFGKYFINGGPKEINGIFGYRTSMSMKNENTWRFANNYCGKLWTKCGWLTLALSTFGLLCVIGQGEEVIGNVGNILCGVQCVFLVGSIYPTEVALKKKFDKYGSLK